MKTRMLACLFLGGCGLIVRGHYRAEPDAEGPDVTRDIALFVVPVSDWRDTRAEGRKTWRVSLTEVTTEDAFVPMPRFEEHSDAIGDSLREQWSVRYGLDLARRPVPAEGAFTVADLLTTARDEGFEQALVVAYEPFSRWSDVAGTSTRGVGSFQTTTIELDVYRGFLFVPAAGLFTVDGARTWTFERFGWVQVSRLPNLLAWRERFEPYVITRSEIGSPSAEEAAANAARLLTPGGLFPEDFVPPRGAKAAGD